MLVSYHNHTRWSDGSATLAAMIQAARIAGLDELGISDHYTVAPPGPAREWSRSWSMDLDLLGDYVTQLRLAATECSSPRLRLGIEADFFPETVEELRERLAPYPWDYVIGSVHFVDEFPIDEGPEFWSPLSEARINDLWRGYWERVRLLAESRAFDFLAHPDLPKRFGYRPTIDLRAEAEAALDALAAAGMALEINTAGWHLPAAEAYPAPWLLRAARARNIPLLINADAHFPEFLTRSFDRARALAGECGYTELVRYERRQALPYPIPAERA